MLDKLGASEYHSFIHSFIYSGWDQTILTTGMPQANKPEWTQALGLKQEFGGPALLNSDLQLSGSWGGPGVSESHDKTASVINMCLK